MIIKLNKKHLVIISLCALIAVTTIIGSLLKSDNAVAVSSEITNWGLSFKEDGKAPIGNLSQTELSKYGAAFIGNEKEKKIYLTFDAGFEAGYTDNILNVLKKQNVKACFFIVGNYLETAPDLVKRMALEGHTVANHTYSHPDMSKIADKEDFIKELSRVEQLYKEITGQEMKKYYRPPQGKFSISNLKNAQSLGYKTVFWSLAYVDWEQNNQPSKETAFSKLLPRVHPGCVLLLHSTSETNSNILDELITKYKEMGYTFGTIEELFN